MRNRLRIRALLLQHVQGQPIVPELLRLPADEDSERDLWRIFRLRDYLPDRIWCFWSLPVVHPDMYLELCLPEPDKLDSVLLRDERLQPVCELPLPDPDSSDKQLRLLYKLFVNSVY